MMPGDSNKVLEPQIVIKKILDYAALPMKNFSKIYGLI
jgi:hypothetical protein